MNGITVQALHRQLGRLVAEGHGRRKVTVDFESFEGEMQEVTHRLVQRIGIEHINVCDDDGGSKTNADGTERYTTVLTLAGGAPCNSKGQILRQRPGSECPEPIE